MQDLTEFGLTEQESKIYYSLLEFEELTASEIAKNTKINRSVAYSYIESLINKGLVSYFIKNNVKYFKAANPETLLHYLREKEVKLKSLLPKLKDIKKTKTEEISVEVYNGVGGGITILKDMIRTKEDIYIIGEAGQPEEIIPIYLKQYIRQLNENKIKEKILGIRDKKIFRGKYSEIKYLPKEFEIPTSTVIYGDKVVIVIYNKPYFAVLINNKKVSQSYRKFFNLLWKIASK